MITRRDFLKATVAGGALVSVGKVLDAKATILQVVSDPLYCVETNRKISVIDEVDVIVVGGSSGAVSAAVAAAKAGSKVFLVAGMPYLGDDICGSFMYSINKKEEQAQTAIARKIYLQIPPEEFSDIYAQKSVPTPLHVKTVLETELIENKIQFLYSSYVTNVLTDTSKQAAGVVIANRSGRQAIKCKAILDTTVNASVAEMFGAHFYNFKSESQQFEYTVVGNAVKVWSGLQKAEIQPFTFLSKGKKYPVTRYVFNYEVKDKSYSSLMEVEQFVRDKTWDANQVDSADLLWYTPSYSIVPEKYADEICSLDSLEKAPYVHNIIRYTPDGFDTVYSVHALPKEIFAPKGLKNIWVMGSCAAIPRDVATWLMRPVQAMTLGEVLGEYISNKIKNITLISPVRVVHKSINASDYGNVSEILLPLRASMNKGFVNSEKGYLPVLGIYDVVVLGGGTAGAPAGISAAMHGAKTLVLEYLHGLGGISTLGFIGRYWDGFREGYTAVIDQGVRNMAPEDHPRQMKNWKVDSRADWKMEWYRRELRKAGAHLWFGVLGCGAVVKDNKVEGVVIATPFGRGVILADLVIDSTGSADIAIAAGASFEYTGKKTIAVQGAGFSQFELNDYYNNTDWALIDDTDILDVSRIYIQGKVKYQGGYDIGKIPQTRERRRVIGEYIISVYDVINHRRYEDTISYHKSSFDTHGMTVDPFFTLNPPEKRHVIYDADVPLRSLLPKGLDGIFTTGLGASAHRDAMPVIRMQPCLQNQGYAVGYLAALCIKEKKAIRQIDLKKVQKHLVSIGSLPQRVLTDKEFKGFTKKEFKVAAETVTDNYKGLEVLLTDKDRCLELLGKQMNAVKTSSSNLIYASVLCILEDKTYTSVLTDEIKLYPQWDEGWHYTASAQFGACLSRLDSLIMALGNAKDPDALAVILEKAEQLKLEDYFSHYRAITRACEAINSKEAIPVLHKLLTQEGMRYHDLASFEDARRNVVPYIHDITYRNRALKELLLARSLYCCGDKDKTGEKVLKRYAAGIEGHYARYASEILKE